MIFLAMAAWWAAEAALVQAPVVNMYSRASLDADVVSQAGYGARVTILRESAGWAEVQTADAYKGWAPLASLRKGDAAYGGRARVRALFAHLYREPSVTKQAPVLTVPFESPLEIVGEGTDKRWLQVRLVDDRSAWVQRGDLEFGPAKASIPEMLALAKRFLGLPYTWGGTTSFGYDCSGYTQMLCRRRGVVMPRDADEQALWSGMREVAKTSLEPGDLLFFGASMKKITHTGMYLGNGEFIHATVAGHPEIQISRLAEPHWTGIYLCARRPKENW
jgi:SH3-like domain-containing protein